MPFNRVVFSLEKEEDGQQIRYRKPQPGRLESMSEMLHPNWRTRLSHLGKRHKERVRKCRERVLRFPIQLMFIQASISEIRESFLRINTQGRKITTADAIFTSPTSRRSRRSMFARPSMLPELESRQRVIVCC